jgi:hypothetical protein
MYLNETLQKLLILTVHQTFGPRGLLWLLTFGLAIFFWVVHDCLFPEVGRPSFVWEFYFRSCVVCGFSISLSVLTVSFKLHACTSFLIHHFKSYIVLLFQSLISETASRRPTSQLLSLDVMTHVSQPYKLLHVAAILLNFVWGSILVFFSGFCL